MSDELRVRDHSQPCEHGEKGSHLVEWVYCPGGREIVLRLVGDQKAGKVWVEEVRA